MIRASETAAGRRRHALLPLLGAVAALVLAACSGGDPFADDPMDPTADNYAGRRLAAPVGPEAPRYGANLSGKLTIGVVISSSGPGKDFQQLANGTRVVPALVGNEDVEVKVEDDRGTPEGAAAAVSKLRADGASALVYGSIGPHLDAGLKAAAGVPVVLAYDGNPALVSQNQNAFSLALPTADAADKMAEFAADGRRYQRIALLWDRDTQYGQDGAAALRDALVRQGRTPVMDAGYGVADAQLRPLALQVSQAAPDAVFVWADAANAYRMINELHVTGSGAQVFIAPAAATPALGSQDVNAIAPPVRIGTLSVGLAGGPWNPTPAVQAFYDRRAEAAGKTSADLGVADIVSADAGLAIVAAAEAEGASADQIRRGLDGLSFEGVGGSYEFRNRVGVTEDDYAIVAYNREPGANQTYVGRQFPDTKTAGGFFVAVPGSAPSLQDLNRFEG